MDMRASKEEIMHCFHPEIYDDASLSTCIVSIPMALAATLDIWMGEEWHLGTKKRLGCDAWPAVERRRELPAADAFTPKTPLLLVLFGCRCREHSGL